MIDFSKLSKDVLARMNPKLVEDVRTQASNGNLNPKLEGIFTMQYNTMFHKVFAPKSAPAAAQPRQPVAPPQPQIQTQQSAVSSMPSQQVRQPQQSAVRQVPVQAHQPAVPVQAQAQQRVQVAPAQPQTQSYQHAESAVQSPVLQQHKRTAPAQAQLSQKTAQPVSPQTSQRVLSSVNPQVQQSALPLTQQHAQPQQSAMRETYQPAVSFQTQQREQLTAAQPQMQPQRFAESAVQSQVHQQQIRAAPQAQQSQKAAGPSIQPQLQSYQPAESAVQSKEYQPQLQMREEPIVIPETAELEVQPEAASEEYFAAAEGAQGPVLEIAGVSQGVAEERQDISQGESAYEFGNMAENVTAAESETLAASEAAAENAEDEQSYENITDVPQFESSAASLEEEMDYRDAKGIADMPKTESSSSGERRGGVSYKRFGDFDEDDGGQEIRAHKTEEVQFAYYDDKINYTKADLDAAIAEMFEKYRLFMQGTVGRQAYDDAVAKYEHINSNLRGDAGGRRFEHPGRDGNATQDTGRARETREEEYTYQSDDTPEEYSKQKERDNGQRYNESVQPETEAAEFDKPKSFSLDSEETQASDAGFNKTLGDYEKARNDFSKGKIKPKEFEKIEGEYQKALTQEVQSLLAEGRAPGKLKRYPEPVYRDD